MRLVISYGRRTTMICGGGGCTVTLSEMDIYFGGLGCNNAIIISNIVRHLIDLYLTPASSETAALFGIRNVKGCDFGRCKPGTAGAISWPTAEATENPSI